jgi:hypothetical protein
LVCYRGTRLKERSAALFCGIPQPVVVIYSTRFGTTYRFHPYGSGTYRSNLKGSRRIFPLKMGLEDCPETSVITTTRSIINTEGSSYQLHHDWNLNSRIYRTVLASHRTACSHNKQQSVNDVSIELTPILIGGSTQSIIIDLAFTRAGCRVWRRQLCAITVPVNKHKGTLHIVCVPAKSSRRTELLQREEQGWIYPGRRIIVVIWILYGGL